MVSWSSYWDAEYFLRTATSGYEFPSQTFFPLMSILTNIFGRNQIFNHMETSLIIAAILGLGTFIVFYNLAILKIGKTHAKKALVIFCCFPTTIFLNANYSEPPFLFFTLLSFLLLEKKYYILSALFAGIGTSARLAATGITISYLFVKTNIKKKTLMIFLSATGVVAYMIYLTINYNDPFFFIKAQRNWCKTFTPCITMFPLYTPIYFLINFSKLLSYPTLIIDWLSTVIFLILTIKVHKRFGIIYTAFTLYVLCLWLTNGKIVSMSRYVLAAFPVFFILPEILKTKKALVITCAILLIIQLVYICLFVNYLFVA